MGVFPSFAAVAAPEQFTIFTTMFPDGPPSENIAAYVTTDGINFTTPDGVTNPVGTYEMNGGNDGTVDTEAMDAMYYHGATYNYWVCYEQVGGYPYTGFSQSTLGISGSVTKDGPFVWVSDVEIFG